MGIILICGRLVDIMATGTGRELEALDDVTATDSVTDAAVVLTEFSKRMYCTYKYSLV